MPVRTLKKSYRGRPSLIMSRKALNPSVFCESTLERDFHKLLDFYFWVVSYEEQPVKIPYVDWNGRLGEYTPDTKAVLRLAGGEDRWIFEVKFRSDLRENWLEYKPKFRGAIRYCRNNGYARFKIMTDVEIRSGYKVENVKLFLKNRHSTVEPDLLAFMLRALSGQATISTRSLLESVWNVGVDKNDACVALYHLIANHRVGLDLDAEFTYDSELWMLPEPAMQTGGMTNPRTFIKRPSPLHLPP